MENLTASKWNTVLIWALAFHCMLVVQCASSQDLENGILKLQCEMFPVESCAFAVGAGGFRCVLETSLQVGGSATYKCQTLRFTLQLGSDTYQSTRNAYIETDHCIKACGLRRLTIGISTDDILYDNSFKEKLCSPTCKQGCANIIDHYDTIMAEQGEDLNTVCESLTEYLNAERERPTTNVESSRRRYVSGKHHEFLYEEAPGPSGDRAPGPNSDPR